MTAMGIGFKTITLPDLRRIMCVPDCYPHADMVIVRKDTKHCRAVYCLQFTTKFVEPEPMSSKVELEPK